MHCLITIPLAIPKTKWFPLARRVSTFKRLTAHMYMYMYIQV